MSANVKQVYDGNPTVSPIPLTALVYLGLSPYGGSDNSAVLWSQILASISAQIQSGLVWVDVTGTTQAMLPNHGYVPDNVGLVTFTLPATCGFGDTIKVTGFGDGGWRVNVGLGQTIHVGADGVTLSTGHIASTNKFDCVTLRCVVPDAEFVVEAVVGIITVA